MGKLFKSLFDVAKDIIIDVGKEIFEESKYRTKEKLKDTAHDFIDRKLGNKKNRRRY